MTLQSERAVLVTTWVPSPCRSKDLKVTSESHMKVLNKRGILWELTGKHVISWGYHGDTTDAITITYPS